MFPRLTEKSMLTYEEEMRIGVIYRRKIEERIRAGFSAALKAKDATDVERLISNITENKEAAIDLIVTAAGNFPADTGVGEGPEIISRDRAKEMIEEEIHMLRSAIAERLQPEQGGLKNG